MLIVSALNGVSNFRSFRSGAQQGDDLYPTKHLTLSLRALMLHNYPFFKSDYDPLVYSPFIQ